MHLFVHRGQFLLAGALMTCAFAAACGGGGGQATPTVPISTPVFGITPKPGQSPQAAPTLGPAGGANSVPAPVGSDLTGLLAGGSAAVPYLSKLAASVATPTPPVGTIAINGVVQSVNGSTLTISTGASPSPNAAPYVLATNDSLPPLLTVSITNSTLVDSPNGIKDLTIGTLIIAAGTLSSGATLNAAAIAPVTTGNLTTGKLRKRPRLAINSAQESRLAVMHASGRAIGAFAASEIVPDALRPLATADAQTEFSETKGLPGINVTVPFSVPIGKCFDLDVGVTFVLGFGVAYSWPMSISATEPSPIRIGTAGTVAMFATGIVPSAVSPNFEITDGATAILSGSVSVSCLVSQTYSLPSTSVGEAIAVSASIPAQFGDTPTTLSASSGIGNITCLPIAPFPGEWAEWLETLGVGLQACPHIVLQSGALQFGSINAEGGTLLVAPGALMPAASLSVEPTNGATLSYSITGTSPQYSYAQLAGLDVQLMVGYQVVASGTTPLVSSTLAPPLSSSGAMVLNWTLPAAAALTPAPTPTPRTTPTASPTIPPTASPTAIPGYVYTHYNAPEANAGTSAIANGPDGALWFTEVGVNRIGRITTTGVVTDYPIPMQNALAIPSGFIAAGSDGALWFTEWNKNVGTVAIGRITTAGSATQYLTGYNMPEDITLGPDRNMWFTVAVIQVAKITPSGSITYYINGGAGFDGVEQITTGPDGALWFTEEITTSSGHIDGIGRITTAGTAEQYFAGISPNAYPYGIATGSDGALWFTESRIPGRIGRITTSGKVTEFTAGTGFNQLIVPGPDGALWFTSVEPSQIGRITTAGAVTMYPYSGEGLVFGPDGALWFTLGEGGIGRLQFSH